MNGARQILVSGRARRLALAAAVVGALAGCGQKGALYLPAGEAAAGRAPLPETLLPSTAVTTPAGAASAAPQTGKATPLRIP